MTTRRHLITFIAATALTLGAIAAAPAASAGGGASTSCATAGTATISPGFSTTQQAQTISVKGKLRSCSGGGVSSAKMKGTLNTPSASCTSGQPATGTLKLTWNTGAQSRESVTLTQDGSDPSLFFINGTVTAGLFAGELVSGSVTLTPTQGDCLFTPITEADFAGNTSH